MWNKSEFNIRATCFGQFGPQSGRTFKMRVINYMLHYRLLP